MAPNQGRSTLAMRRALWTCSAGHRLGRSAAAVLGEARYTITTGNEAVEPVQVVALARTWRPGPQPGHAHRRWPGRADVVEVHGDAG